MTLIKTALVTGAARRIGAHLARALAADGFAVAIHCRQSRNEADALAAEIATKGGKAAVIMGDLADPQALEAVMATAAAALGPIGLLVNNASEFEPDAVPNLDRAGYERRLAVNLTAPIFLAQAFAQNLPEGADGLVVHIVDQRVLKPTPQYFSYTLSKQALWAATRTLAQALAPRIRVNAIAPGPTLASSRQSPEDFDKQTAATLLGHGPDLADFTAALRFLIAARSVTGQMIALDGGQHLIWQTADVIGLTE